MEEIWKDVVGYEGFYQVSNLGRVKGCERMIVHFRGGLRKLKEKIRKCSKDTDGYLVLDLYKDGKGKFHKVHRLVAMAFCEMQNGKNEVNHINGNKEDNNLCNLEWCNASENQLHAFRIGLKKPQINNEKAVFMYSKDNKEFIMEFKSIANASKHLNCTTGDIVSVLKGRQKSVRNHIFEYKY